MSIHRSDEVLALLREPSHAQLATLRPDGAPEVAIRGRVVEMTTEGAGEQISALAKKSMSIDDYPCGSPDETRITLRIAAEPVSELQRG